MRRNGGIHRFNSLAHVEHGTNRGAGGDGVEHQQVYPRRQARLAYLKRLELLTDNRGPVLPATDPLEDHGLRHRRFGQFATTSSNNPHFFAIKGGKDKTVATRAIESLV